MQINTAQDLLKSFEHALDPLYGQREAQSLARMACCHLLGYTLTSDLFLYLHLPVNQNIMEMGTHWMAEMAQGKPIQHLIGRVPFAGLELRVDARVLIPRPETEELAHRVQHRLGSGFKGRILDIGTGSGCLALACKRFFPLSEVAAMDVSAAAVQIARHNTKANNLEVDVQVADMFASLPKALDKEYDVILSNPPYLGKDEYNSLDKNVLGYEPHLALFSPSADPLACYKAIACICQKHLATGGRMYLELSEYHANATAKLFENDFFTVDVEYDLQGKERFLMCESKRATLPLPQIQ
ncbi:MAG: peptide chain release factor N(5)-glutamine methyltransferase [Bacteroidetes bacterium]|nr:peptide chain release factor N(5)-glutamine methyltransferase [Bacteroidota bacterium]